MEASVFCAVLGGEEKKVEDKTAAKWNKQRPVKCLMHCKPKWECFVPAVLAAVGANVHNGAAFQSSV